MIQSAEDETGHARNPNSKTSIMNRALVEYASKDLAISHQIAVIKKEVATGACSQARTLGLALDEFHYVGKSLENIERTLNKMADRRTLPEVERHERLLQEKRIGMEWRLSAIADRLWYLANKASEVKVKAENAMAQAEELEILALEAEDETR